MALKDGDEEEDQAADDGEKHEHVDQVVVYPLDRNAQKEDTDGKFRDYHGNGVPKVAEPPVLLCCQYLSPEPVRFAVERMLTFRASS